MYTSPDKCTCPQTGVCVYVCPKTGLLYMCFVSPHICTCCVCVPRCVYIVCVCVSELPIFSSFMCICDRLTLVCMYVSLTGVHLSGRCTVCPWHMYSTCVLGTCTPRVPYSYSKCFCLLFFSPLTSTHLEYKMVYTQTIVHLMCVPSSEFHIVPLTRIVTLVLCSCGTY